MKIKVLSNELEKIKKREIKRKERQKEREENKEILERIDEF